MFENTRQRRGQVRWPILALAVLHLLMASPGVASPAEDLVNLSLEELMRIEVVYAASRFPQSPREAPASVTIVTADEIRQFGYQSLAELLGGMRGFAMTYDRNYDYASARGLGQAGDSNSRVLVLLDGQRTNDGLFDAAGLGRDFLIDMDLIDRVEIVRGPGSSLYGTSAFIGLVNVVTKRGADLAGGELALGVASRETGWTRFSYGDKLDNGLDYLVSASAYDSAGGRLFYPEFDEPGNGGGLVAGADGEQSYRIMAKAAFKGLTVQASVADRDKGIPTAPWGSVFGTDRTRTRDTRRLLDASFERSVGTAGTLLARVALSSYEFNGFYLWDYGDEDEPYLVVNRDISNSDWWGAELQYHRHLSSRHRLTIGVEYRDNYRQDQQNLDEEVYFDDHRSSDVLGAYLLDELQLSDRLRLQAGLRFDSFQGYQHEVSPRFSAIYTPTEISTLKLLYGGAFRAPNAYELYYHDGFDTVKPPLKLKSEQLSSVELIWEQQLGSNWRGLISAYDLHVSDMIAFTTDPTDGLIVFTNVAMADAEGVEAELEGRLRGGLAARLSYAFQKTRDRATGSQLTGSPEHLATVQLRHPFFGDRLSAGVELRYTGARSTAGGNRESDFLLTNLTLLARPFGERLSISASLLNLFDTAYGHPASEEHLQDLIRQDGRSFRLQLTRRF